MSVCSFLIVRADPVPFHVGLSFFAIGLWIFFAGLWLLGMLHVAVRIFRPEANIPGFWKRATSRPLFRRKLILSLVSSKVPWIVSVAMLFLGGCFVLIGTGSILSFALRRPDVVISALRLVEGRTTSPAPIVTYNTVVNPFNDATSDPGIGPFPPPEPRPPAASPVDYGWIARLFLLLFFGAGLVLVGILFRNFWPVFAGSALLLIGTIPKIAIEGKIGEVMLFKSTGNMESRVDFSAKDGGLASGGLSSTPIGQIRNFSSGCANVEGIGCRPGQSLEFLDQKDVPIARDTLFRTVCNKEVVLLVGRTDRVRLSPDLQTRYESNVGLAQERAESVRRKISQICLVKGLPIPSLITQVAGPRDTPPFEGKKHQVTQAYGSKDDRSVEIMTLEERNGSQESKKVKESEN
jgi:hypothetical protein